MDLPTMIRNRLIEYYIEREFGGGKLAVARAEEVQKEIASLSIRLHAALVRGGLHRLRS